MKFYLHNTTSISVVDAKFHKNPLFCLRDLHFFQTAVTNLSYRYDYFLADVICDFFTFQQDSAPAHRACANVSWDILTSTAHVDWPRNSPAWSQSGGLCDLGHSALTNLPLPDLWRRPSERTDWRVASFWSEHYWQSSESVAWSTTWNAYAHEGDTTNIRFEHFDRSDWHQLHWKLMTCG